MALVILKPCGIDKMLYDYQFWEHFVKKLII